MNDAPTAYYLYCLAPSHPALALGEDVFVRVSNRIAAVLGQVPRAEFCGEAAEKRLTDLAWLAPRVCRHEAVVEQVMSQSPVLPARFATLFVSLESLEGFLGKHRAAIHEFFTRLGAQREWAVKGMLDRALAGRRGGSLLRECEHSPGANYLQKKRAEAEAAEQTSQWLRTACQGAARELEQRASDFRERRLWNGSDSDAPSEVILNWAFLVPAGAESDFRRLVMRLDERHRDNGLSFTLSGPWPPYSFAPALGRETTP